MTDDPTVSISNHCMWVHTEASVWVICDGIPWGGEVDVSHDRNLNVFLRSCSGTFFVLEI